ncbi:MAG: hypothetical protein P0119_10000 [Nitrospira sp.]|nr:hypothetical protein [Nitrospira sp.]
MIVIVASRYDAIAGTLRQCWQSHDARLLTAGDLSKPGWRFFPDDMSSSTAIIQGQEVGVREIGGVLTRLTCVPEQELGHIVAADRPYVAVEMTAFLLAWLISVPCHVLNRPTPTGLCGPAWRKEQWTYAAARAGLLVSAVQRQVSFGPHRTMDDPAANVARITVVGKRCLGEGHATLALQARRLAEASGVDLLAVDFSSPEPGALFIGAHPFPDLTDNEVTHAVLEYFCSVGAARGYATPSGPAGPLPQRI